MTDPSSPDVAPAPEPSAPPASDPRPRRTSYVRVVVWLVLLGATIAFWFVARSNPEILRRLAAWWPADARAYPTLSAAEHQAEQAARRKLEASGALVVAEGETKAVTSVSFRGDSLDPSTVRLIPALRRVSSLNLGASKITDEQLEFLSGLPILASLVLSDTSVGDAGLEHLSALPNLEVIHLRETQVTDAGLNEIAKIQTLKILDLSGSQVTDAGMVELVPLENLSWLLLEDLDITDAGLKPLHAVKSLRQLTLFQTRVSAEGVTRIRKAIPGLTVDR